MNASERILERIRRLLALAGSANEHEAAAAAAKAQELLRKYNLSLHDIPNDQRPQYENREFCLYDAAKWRRLLMATICKFNSVKMIRKHQLSEDGFFVGLPHNVEVVIYLYNYLERALERIAKEEWKAIGIAGAPQSQWLTGFRYGFIDIIYKRMEAEQRKAEADVNTSALIVIDEADLIEAYNRFHPKQLSSASRNRKVLSSAYNAGKAAGANVPLNKAVRGQAEMPAKQLR